MVYVADSLNGRRDAPSNFLDDTARGFRTMISSSSYVYSTVLEMPDFAGKEL